MLAGAFAGIAVRHRSRRHVLASTDLMLGTLGHVSGRSTQGVQLCLKLFLSCGQCADSQQTRMQIVNPSPSAMYSGISNAMVTISRAEGFWSLWRGLSSVVMGAGGHSLAHTRHEMELTAQVPRMLSTLPRMKPRNTPSVATKERATSIIPSQQVRNSNTGKCPYGQLLTIHSC